MRRRGIVIVCGRRYRGGDRPFYDCDCVRIFAFDVFGSGSGSVNLVAYTSFSFALFLHFRSTTYVVNVCVLVRYTVNAMRCMSSYAGVLLVVVVWIDVCVDLNRKLKVIWCV